MIGMMDFQATRWTIDGDVPIQEGNHHPTLVPMGCFHTADGVINLAGSGGRLLENFLSAVGLDELNNDPRFASTTKRSANRNALNAPYRRATADADDSGLDRDVQRRRCTMRARVPPGPGLRRPAGAAPRPRHRGRAPGCSEEQALVRNPVTIVGAGPTVRRPTPDIGEHTGEVLAELGLSQRELHDLGRQGVLQGCE